MTCLRKSCRSPELWPIGIIYPRSSEEPDSWVHPASCVSCADRALEQRYKVWFQMVRMHVVFEPLHSTLSPEVEASSEHTASKSSDEEDDPDEDRCDMHL